jgi:glycosyltransferase involved in cell wall biosynthesis
MPPFILNYHQGHFIFATIQSVLDQDYPALEYRIVDGGSRDETIEILSKFGQKLHWVSEPDLGQADAINKGFRQSGGDVLGWLNADDLYYDGALSLVAREFEADPHLMMVYGDAYHIDAEGKFLDKYHKTPLLHPWLILKFTARTKFSQSCLCTSM